MYNSTVCTHIQQIWQDIDTWYRQNKVAHYRCPGVVTEEDLRACEKLPKSAGLAKKIHNSNC